MSEKKILIVIHGVGIHTDDSFKKEVVDAANNALHRYQGYTDKKFEDYVDVKPVSYDHIFETIRKRFVEANAPIAKFFTDNPDLSSPLSIIKKAGDLEAKFGKESLLSTHALDLLLYLSNVGEWVRTKVAEKIVQIVHDNPITPINILSHSLGTGVLHDTLSKLMMKNPSPGTPSLDPALVKFSTIWTFANVSRLLSNYSGQPHPYKTIVKPGDFGCTRMFFNVRHELDPFTRPMMFDPKLTDDWVRPDVYHNDYFKLITNKISRLNTHDIGAYIEDPSISVPFLRVMMNFKASREEIKEGNKKFKTLPGQYDLVKEKFREIDDFSDLKDFFELLKAFKDFIA